jgi:predicted metal-dependent phosphoesterase TrpH
VRSGRLRRAEAMAEGLAAAGVLGAHTAHDALQGALNYAGGADVISRTHFARWLVEIGVCSNTREVFNKYLVQGKPGYVPHQWAHLGEAVQWIGAAGGVAAIAHPGRYRYTDNELWALCTEFKAAGGIALEVATSNHDAGAVRRFAAMARDFGFEASRGSDFHGPAESHAELGRVAALPAGLVPVWHRFV